MKKAFFSLLFAAGIAVAGCSSTKETQSDTDSMTTVDSSGMSGTRGDSTSAPIDTVKPDTIPKDTTQVPPR